jgi:hypothetical protein
MVWHMTKHSHLMSINSWVRAWLRAGILRRTITTLAVIWVLMNVAVGLLFLWLATAETSFLAPTPDLNLFGLLFLLTVLAALVVPLVVFGETLIDWMRTRTEIGTLMSAPDVALATRGEYIGGHPELPHGRFVYLTLGGSLQNPQVTVLLPRYAGKAPYVFSIPVLDLQKATERVKATGTDVSVGGSLADVQYRTKLIGQQTFLNLKYSGEAGREHIVEFGNFFLGDGEVQNWRNHIVCIQAEAETGKKPFGKWKTLPAEQEAEAETD